MPTLRCLIGPSPTSLTPIPVNSSTSHFVSSDLWEGKISVFVKSDSPHSSRNGSRRESPTGSRRASPIGSRRASPTGTPNGSTKEKITFEADSTSHEYFSRPERAGVTWSIQVQGRFLKKHTADDILFGNTFDRPLQLPWGSSAALKFMHFIDPTLEHDLTSSQPWALSPLISTMPYFNHRRIPSGMALNKIPFPDEGSIIEDISHLTGGDDVLSNSGQSPKRRVKFASAENRQEITFGPNDLITTDFCYGFLKFPSLTLSLPAGLSFDLKKYWDGQPVRFVCCERPHPEEGNKVNMVDAKTFWVVQFEIWEDGLEEREGSLIEDDDEFA